MGASGRTGGVVADVGVRAGTGLIVGEDGGEVGVATPAGKWTRGSRGVTRLLHPVIPLNESYVVLHHWYLLPHQRTVPCLGLLHPHVLRRTGICSNDIDSSLLIIY